MAAVSFICSSSEKLDSIPFKAGQIIFVQDQRAIYVDGTERTCYQQIIFLNSEAQRVALSIPIHSFYFIEETKCLWEYDNGWHQITSPPKEQILFDDKDNFHIPGENNILYIDGTDMYRYLDDRYVLISNGSGNSIWVEI